MVVQLEHEMEMELATQLDVVSVLGTGCRLVRLLEAVLGLGSAQRLVLGLGSCLDGMMGKALVHRLEIWLETQ